MFFILLIKWLGISIFYKFPRFWSSSRKVVFYRGLLSNTQKQLYWLVPQVLLEILLLISSCFTTNPEIAFNLVTICFSVSCALFFCVSACYLCYFPSSLILLESGWSACPADTTMFSIIIIFSNLHIMVYLVLKLELS